MQNPSWQDLKRQFAPRCAGKTRAGQPCRRIPTRPSGYCRFHGGAHPHDRPLLRHLLHAWANAPHPLPTAITLRADAIGVHQVTDAPPGGRIVHVTRVASLVLGDFDPAPTYTIVELRNPIHYSAICDLDRRVRIRWLPDFVDILIDTRRAYHKRHYLRGKDAHDRYRF